LLKPIDIFLPHAGAKEIFGDKNQIIPKEIIDFRPLNI